MAQIRHENITNAHKKTLNRGNKNNIEEKRENSKIIGAIPQYPEKKQISFVW
jgi:hypothetical protein